MIKGLETMSHAVVFGQRNMEPSRQKKLSPTQEELSPLEAELTWVDRKKKHEELFGACSALDLGEEREKEKSLRFLSCAAQFTKTGDQSGIQKRVLAKESLVCIWLLEPVSSLSGTSTEWGYMVQ